MKSYFAKASLFFSRSSVILIVYCILALGTSIHSYYLGPKEFDGRNDYTHYNNYKIFKHSFFHLVNQQDIYQLYPEEQWDLYKYSPAFALFFGAFAVLPDIVGLSLWNLLNAFILLYAVFKLPQLSRTTRVAVLWFMLIELSTALLNAQSNALMTGLIILALVFFEEKRPWLASLMILLSVFIKIFGAVAFLLFLFYPKKNQFILASLFWSVVLALIPLLVIPFNQLLLLYESWLDLLASDHAQSIGLSVMGWLDTWFGLSVNSLLLLAVGVVLLFLPLLRWERFRHYPYRLMMLASLLIWMVIFNHKAESPTFIIAVAGVAIWYYPQLRKTENLVLVIFVFIFTTLSPTDLFPASVKNSFLKPYVIKVVPVIAVWLKLLYDMIFAEIELKTVKDNSSPKDSSH